MLFIVFGTNSYSFFNSFIVVNSKSINLHKNAVNNSCSGSACSMAIELRWAIVRLQSLGWYYRHRLRFGTPLKVTKLLRRSLGGPPKRLEADKANYLDKQGLRAMANLMRRNCSRSLFASVKQ